MEWTAVDEGRHDGGGIEQWSFAFDGGAVAGQIVLALSVAEREQRSGEDVPHLLRTLFQEKGANRILDELNRDQVGTRSLSSNSGSSSNLGQSRSTRAIGSRLMRAINA